MNWVDQAKNLAYGSSRKILHCGSSPAARINHSNIGVNLFCFRCGANEFIPHGPRSASEILAARQATERLIEDRDIPRRALPLYHPDCPTEALLWPLVTGLSPEEASDTYGMRYDPITRRVCVPLAGGFIARAVYKENPKYIRAGAADVVVYELVVGTDLVVVTEDILSAIKIYRAGYSVISILGTAVTPAAASRIGAYKNIVVWTDGDKAGDAAYSKLRKRLGLYDSTVSRVRTDQDPKLLQITEIQQRLGATK
jgi:hypothetical protein